MMDHLNCAVREGSSKVDSHFPRYAIFVFTKQRFTKMADRDLDIPFMPLGVSPIATKDEVHL